jgi:DNA-binding MarR family transcriptional regulator
MTRVKRRDNASPKASKTRAVIIDLTPEQKKIIKAHCTRHNTSLAKFLTESVLQDLTHKPSDPHRTLKIAFAAPLNYAESQKLDLFAELQEVKPTEFVRKIFRETLHQILNQHHVAKASNRHTYTTSLVISERDYKKITQHVNDLNVSARKYIPFVAMQTIAKSGKQRA